MKALGIVDLGCNLSNVILYQESAYFPLQGNVFYVMGSRADLIRSVFWDMTPCSLLALYRCFRTLSMETVLSSESLETNTTIQYITFQSKKGDRTYVHNHFRSRLLCLSLP
jgi:hypothetical protein